MAKSIKIKAKGNIVFSDTLSGGYLKTPKRIVLTHRVLENIDLGVYVEVQEGYKLCLALAPALAARGLVASNTPGNFTTGNVSIMVVNVGREIVEIKEGDVVATCWLEPILKMDVEELA